MKNGGNRLAQSSQTKGALYETLCTESHVAWIALCIPALVGCDRTVSEEKTVEQKNGKTEVKENKTVEKPDGTIEKTSEHTVSK